MFHEAQGKNINIYSFKNYFIPLQFENQIYLSSGINNLDVPACVWHHQSRLIRRGHHFWSTVGSKTFLNKQFIFLQVVLCQSDLFYHQSRQNMTTNCSSNLLTYSNLHKLFQHPGWFKFDSGQFGPIVQRLASILLHNRHICTLSLTLNTPSYIFETLSLLF